MLYIFDWDGTLCDSLEKIVRCLQRAAYQAGEVDLSPERARQIIGLALPEAMNVLFPHASQQQRSVIAQNYRQVFLQDTNPAPLFDGVRETLAQLRQQGHRIAVATGKARVGLNRSLAETGLENRFCATRCADETASKPNPKMLFELLHELEHPVEEAVMIGDTTFDLEMASAAGMRAIGVTFGSHGVEQLRQHSPVEMLGSITELLNWPLKS